VVNNERGEFTVKIAGLEIGICPSYGRQARATAAVGGRSTQALLLAMSAEGLDIAAQANYLEQLSKPRIKAEDIGKALAKAGALKAAEIMGVVIKNLAKGYDDDEEDEDESELLDEDEDGGK